ncbi:hypothetical protein [Streptomyces sp. NPDC048172]|uniref:hypothetical protein n=1 Tax=Streptomyces sp. NPDC048172 TaxID=3365505 RepID=UPI0037226189
MSEQAEVTLTAIARIGGEAALHKLSDYKALPDREIRQQLVLMWQYFDARAFAAEVLAGMPLDDVTVQLTSSGQMTCLTGLRRPVPRIHVPGYLLEQPGLMDALAQASVVALDIGSASGVSRERSQTGRWTSTLRRLTVHACDRLTDVSGLAGGAIEELDLRRVSSRLDYGGLAEAPSRLTCPGHAVARRALPGGRRRCARRW